MNYSVEREGSEFRSCDECSFSFYLYPDRLSPYDILSIFKIAPTYIGIAGQTHIGMAGKPSVRPGFIAKKSIIAVKSAQFILSKDIRDHIDYVFGVIKEDVDGLKNILNRNDVSRRMYLSWWSNMGYGGPIIRHDQIRFAADLDIDIDSGFSCYNIDIEDVERGVDECQDKIKSCRIDVIAYERSYLIPNIQDSLSSLLSKKNEFPLPDGRVCDANSVSIIFSSYNILETRNISDLIEFILKNSDKIMGEIHSIKNKDYSHFVIRITLHLMHADCNAGFFLRGNDIRCLANFGIDCEFDIRWPF